MTSLLLVPNDCAEAISLELQRCPGAVAPFAAIVAQVALEIRPKVGARRLAQLASGVGQRESIWGARTKPPGAGGWGDWGKRAWRESRFAAYADIALKGEAVLDAKTGLQVRTASGELVFWARPLPGQGWGFGLMQLDGQAHPELVRRKTADGRFAWADILEGLRMTMRILNDGLVAFPGDERGGVDAFNAGARAVHDAEAHHLDPDQVTADHNYGADVADHVDSWFGTPAQQLAALGLT